VVRGRVVIVVEWSNAHFEESGKTVYKAKNHSHEYFGEEILSGDREACSLS
jgi:hypothetical protein